MEKESHTEPTESAVDTTLDSLIERVNQGDSAAANCLAELAYDRLHKTAQRIVGFRDGTPTLGATALVGEGFARLFKSDSLEKIRDSHHFYSLFAKMMRQILVDYERSKIAAKRGGDANRVDLDVILSYIGSQQNSAQDLSNAIAELESRYPRAADIIQMKYFAFMTVDEIGENTSLSRSTIESDLRLAKAFIKAQLT